MNPQPSTISIILPTYNGAKLIRQSIESCLRQTYPHIELIIVDDCSTDETPQIIQSIKDPRIKYIRNQTNQRLPRSLNIGFAAAKGDYLTWTSDDNEFLPQAMEELLKYLTDHPEVDFVYTDMIVRYFETGKEELRKFSDLNLEKENNVGASYLYKRIIWETIGGYDPRFEWVEDYDYWIRISKKFQMRHYPKALYIYGDHGQSLTNTRRYPIVMMRDILRYWHKYLTLHEFLETIRQFSVDVRTHISQRNQQWQAFQHVLKKAFGISNQFGCFYCFLFIFLTLRMVVNQCVGPIIRPVQTWLEKRQLHKTIQQLRKGSGAKQVLCIIPEMVVGGSEKVMWDVVEGLKSQGYEFHLICDRKETNDWCQRFASQFTNVIQLKRYAQESYYLAYLLEVIRRLNIQILLNTNSRVGYRCLPRLKAEFPHLKTIDILHLEYVGGTIEKYAWVAQYLDARICISHHLKQYMLDLYTRHGIDPQLNDRLNVIHNGTPLIVREQCRQSAEEFARTQGIQTDDIVVSFIGRIAIEKKPLMFVDIARQLIQQAPDVRWKFVMAGDGPYLNKVRQRITDYHVQDRFVLPGMLADVKPLLFNSKVFLLVSQHEGIPLVIQEALSMQVPVISSQVGAIHELITDDQNGYLIRLDENAVSNFVAQTLRIIREPAIYQSMRYNTVNSLNPEYLLSTMQEKYRIIFNQITE